MVEINIFELNGDDDSERRSIRFEYTCMYGVGVYLCVLVHLYPTQGPERPCVTRIAHPLYPGVK